MLLEKFKKKKSGSTLPTLNSMTAGSNKALSQLHFWLTDKIQWTKLDVTLFSMSTARNI